MTTNDYKKLAALKVKLDKVRKVKTSPTKFRFMMTTAYDYYTDKVMGYSAQEHDDRLETLSDDFGRDSF